MDNFSEKVNFIWNIADLLRGTYKQSDYGKIILPFTVLRRLDQVLEDTKEAVLEKFNAQKDSLNKEALDRLLKRTARPDHKDFYNTSNYDFQKLLADPNQIAQNLVNYIDGFSENARDIMNKFNIKQHINKLEEKNLLFLVVQEFANPAKIDLHPDRVSNTQMGYIFEELIRKFSEQSNETAGEHFTPREVIQLMVNLLFAGDDADLSKPGLVKTMFDPACGTGGMLSVAEEYLDEKHENIELHVFGQELNDEAFAICKSDMLIKGQDPENIKLGNSFDYDQFKGRTFDYMLCNPPFGVDWRNVKDAVEDEHKNEGFNGRFGAGTPRINDGSFLFLQHMISKMKDPNETEGTRLAIVFNGSPLFTGGAGSSESDIRQWIIENDLLEAIIALPDQLFYNTGILTYVWVLSNKKLPERRGKIQLVNGINFFEKLPRNLGDKRKVISGSQISDITKLYTDFEENDNSKIFNNEDFGYHEITVEQPMRLNFQFSEDRIEQLWDDTIFTNLVTRKRTEKTKEEGRKKQELVLKSLRELGEEYPDIIKDRDEVIRLVENKFDEIGLDIKNSITKAVWRSIAERDESAPLVTKSNGKPIADSDLRDTEFVPLKENIDEYFEREIKPYVDGAWINKKKTRIGYEIPMTRYFYEFEELRPIEDIENEINSLQKEIDTLWQDVEIGGR